MTITETTRSSADEKPLIEAEVDALTQIQILRQVVAQSRKARRGIPRPTAALEAARAALSDALETVEATKTAPAQHEATLAQQWLDRRPEIAQSRLRVCAQRRTRSRA